MNDKNTVQNDTMELASGDDVIIIGEENSIFHEKNGTVKEILPSGKALVHFHKEFSYLFGFEYEQGQTTCEFDLKDLKRFVLDEEPVIKVNRTYQNSYHTLYTLPYKFSPENLCMHNDCSHKAVKRILYNCWGAVCEYDVCNEHNKDGYCGDGFCMNPSYQATVKENKEKS